MRNIINLNSVRFAAVLAAGAGLFGTMASNAEVTVDFSNPATAMSGAAVIASGTCIAKFATVLDDPSKSATEIGQLVAQRCAKEISKSAGLASFMVGKPDEYAKNLKYAQEELTTNAVLRLRASSAKQHTA